MIASSSDDNGKDKEENDRDIEAYRNKLLDGLQGDKSELFTKKNRFKDDEV